MIPATMIYDIAEEIRVLFRDTSFRLKDETGGYRLPNVYEHALPPTSKDAPPRVPWLLVSLYNGEQTSPAEPRRVTVQLICQIFDDNPNMQGYMDAMNMLERICQDLYGKTVIAGKYEVVYPYQFAVLSDVRHPYYSAGLIIRVEMPGTTPQTQIGVYPYD